MEWAILIAFILLAGYWILGKKSETQGFEIDLAASRLMFLSLYIEQLEREVASAKGNARLSALKKAHEQAREDSLRDAPSHVAADLERVYRRQFDVHAASASK